MGIAYSQIAQLDEDILVLEKRLEKTAGRSIVPAPFVQQAPM